MERYTVEGMSCAACVSRVEKAVSTVAGVTQCQVNLLTKEMAVEGTASQTAILQAVEKAGYSASALSASVSAPRKKASASRRLLRRLAVSLVLLAVLMGVHIVAMAKPGFVSEKLLSPVPLGAVEGVLSLALLVINRAFFVQGVKGVRHLSPTMDTLVALGAGTAFVYSAVLWGEALSGVPVAHYYFETAGMIVTLITVGKTLEAYAKGKTTDALENLARLMPASARIRQGEEWVSVPVAQVKPGDAFRVLPGEQFPVDGTVAGGIGGVDESALTGESMPVEKGIGDEVTAGTVNLNGCLDCVATRVGEDTSLAQVMRLVNDATATKAPIARLADKVAGVFVPVVMALALLTVGVWLLQGTEIATALERGVSVLVVSCPCALGLATPVAIMVGSGVGASHGIYFKNATALEVLGRCTTVVLDKTGTLTKGEPQVTGLYPADGVTEEELLTLGVTLESQSEHPLGKAVCLEGERRNTVPLPATDFTVVPGNGLQGTVNGERWLGGNRAFVQESVLISDNMSRQAQRLAQEGKTPLYFAKGERLQGIIAVADKLQEDSREAVAQLHAMGCAVVMLTGDNERTAHAIAREAGITTVIAEVLPQEKEKEIRRLQENARVVMVGDGINDAPALARADVGLAIGAGTNVAMDAADVVLVSNRIAHVPAVVRLGRATLRNIKQNLFWAFFYNSIGIPLAAGVLAGAGLTLTPAFSAAAMSLSGFCVVSNALRLNRCGRFFRNETEYKEEKRMEKTLKVQGMMCPHCEAHVKEALEKVPGVAEAVASHTEGKVTVTLTQEVPFAVLKATVESAGYQAEGLE